ncbi:hypothetical protein QCA50_002804 [Cerrena zonata]|uniref:Exonuclease domain-containing protein n=1 Tax=Cerrena zonata TaxID=2478898 RepID=A0AAW0GHU4_9APHY
MILLRQSTTDLFLLALLASIVLVFVFLRRRRSSIKVPEEAPNDSKTPIAATLPNSIPSPSPSLSAIPPDTNDMIHEPFIDRTYVKQSYDAFLVLDVEATCMPGTDFNYPNEIIEWPVLLLRWKDRDAVGRANKLQVVDEFRSFVKPVWRPQLSPFCTSLTGITQADVDNAPHYTAVIAKFREFLVRHGLIDPVSNTPLVRFCWCTDGPWDIRDFVVKQCFISKIPIPTWLSGDVIDVRRVVSRWQEKHDPPAKRPKVRNLNPIRVSDTNVQVPLQSAFPQPQGTYLPIPRQLHLLSLSPFEGRQHCGLDVSGPLPILSHEYRS